MVNNIVADEVICNRILLRGYLIEAGGDGIYITTPNGVRTKVELIDFRETPVPETAPLRLSPADTAQVPGAVAGGPAPPAGNGNFSGGGGAQGATPESPGSPVQTPPSQTITPGGEGSGYQPISDQARDRLPSALRNDQQFQDCVNSLAQRTNVPADSMLAVMQIESGLNPQAVNRNSGAVGLNQIMPRTAESLGYSAEQIQNMSASEQMCGPVTAYFTRTRLPANPTTADLYLANFYPAAVGRSDDYVLGNNPGLTPELVARQNPAFRNSEGVVTVGSVRQYIANRSGT